ncbi:MAG: class II fructose-bisphosphate aldolase [Candidatus Omnitrophica bacterium]|nr:class II fructose-bisphosphate aldolase [Candidatus Omnitrophota bacterium]
MALVTSKEIYENAEKGGYAVGGFETYWLESIQVFAEAGEKANAPFLIQVTPKRLQHFGIDYFYAVAKVAAEKASVPVVIHLDHGFEFDDVAKAIQCGFTSVMIDGSAYSLEGNIALTKRVVEAAHPAGVSVEAELGKVGGKERGVTVEEAMKFQTDPVEARIFVEETQVDSLAVSIGNASGFYKAEPTLDFHRLEQIKRVVKIPLVLHGGTGIPEDAVRRAIDMGIRKINIATLLKSTFVKGIKSAIAKDPDTIDPRKILDPAKKDTEGTVMDIFKMLGCAGKGGKR